MNSAEYVDRLIADGKAEGKDLQQLAWDAAKACVGWAYVFGAYGEYCDPSNRRSRARTAHPTIKSACKNFNGQDDKPAGCVGCKWFTGTADSKDHEGRTRFFDCRGYVYWILHHVFGMWEKCPAGCTTMWKTAKNWKQKGTVKEGVPENTLVCLFQQGDAPNKMSHIGFGFRGETLECQKGVQYFQKRDKKWTHWAVPACVEIAPQPDPGPMPEKRPTLQKGDKGPLVKIMQQDLMKAGESLSKYGADGSFGNETLEAVKSFQKKHGLVVDGICGPKTWAELIKYE